MSICVPLFQKTIPKLLVFSTFMSVFCSSGAAQTQGDIDEAVIIHGDVIEEYNLCERAEFPRPVRMTSGWSDQIVPYRWAEGLESELVFEGERLESDPKMTIRCAPFTFPDSPPQVVKIALNGEFLGSITLSEGMENYDVPLWHQLIVPGENSIGFKYTYAVRPCDVMDSADTRDLSVGFERIEFDGIPDPRVRFVPDEKAIHQKPGSFFNYYMKMPPNAVVRIEFDKAGGDNCVACLTVACTRDEKKFELSHTGEYEFPMSDFADKIVKIQFDVVSANSLKGTQNEYVVWRKIVIVKKLNDSIQDKPKTSSESHALKEKLQDLDVVFLVLDALHAAHSSVYGYFRETTPFLKELASSGVVFENIYSVAPWTLGSVGSLFTGTYSTSHGLIGDDSRLPDLVPTIAEVLSRNGVRTYCFSENPYLSEYWGLARGFDVSEIVGAGVCEGRILDFLSRVYESGGSAERRFVYVHLVVPHAPYQPPEAFRVFCPEPIEIPGGADAPEFSKVRHTLTQKQIEYLQALYDSNVLYADHLAEVMYGCLEQKGVLEKTVFVVTSDHGEAFMQHGHMGHGLTLYEEFLHVPFIVRFPTKVGISAKRVTQLASLVDVAPTLAYIFGVHDLHFDPENNLLPAILENKQVRSLVLFEYPEPPLIGVRDGKYKYIEGRRRKELYDLETDPEERNNLFRPNSKFSEILSGYYRQQWHACMRMEASEGVRPERLGFEAIDGQTLERLRALGYIK